MFLTKLEKMAGGEDSLGRLAPQPHFTISAGLLFSWGRYFVTAQELGWVSGLTHCESL